MLDKFVVCNSRKLLEFDRNSRNHAQDTLNCLLEDEDLLAASDYACEVRAGCPMCATENFIQISIMIRCFGLNVVSVCLLPCETL
jgi:hypothetical protein